MTNSTSDITAKNPPLRGGGGKYRRLTARSARRSHSVAIQDFRLQTSDFQRFAARSGPLISPERSEQQSWRYAGCGRPLPMRGALGLYQWAATVVGPYQLKHPNTQTLKPFLPTID